MISHLVVSALGYDQMSLTKSCQKLCIFIMMFEMNEFTGSFLFSDIFFPSVRYSKLPVHVFLKSLFAER